MRHIGSSVLTVFFFFMAGCATNTGSTSATSEQEVARRAQERVDALLGGDVAKSMEYTTPSYRQTSTQAQYAAKYAGAGNWTEATVEKVTCEAERCDVTMTVSYQMRQPRMASTRPLDEVWIQVDGQWYIYL